MLEGVLVGVDDECLVFAECNEQRLQLARDHEREQAVEAVQTERVERLLELLEQSQIDDLLARLQVVPGGTLLDVVGGARISDAEHFACQSADEVHAHLANHARTATAAAAGRRGGGRGGGDGRKDGYGNVLGLVDGLVVEDLLLDERVALLLDVVVDDARELLLPDLEAVDVHIVLDVLERSSKAVDLLGQLVEASVELVVRGARVELQLSVQRFDNLEHELFAYAVLEQLLGVDVDAADLGRLHLQDALGVERYGEGAIGDLVAFVELGVLPQLLLVEQCGHLAQLVCLYVDDLGEQREHRHRYDLQHLAHIRDHLTRVVLRHAREVGTVRSLVYFHFIAIHNNKTIKIFIIRM